MLSFIEMSVYGGIMIAAIAVIRALLISKLPKRAFVILWLAAMLRLMLPFELPFAGSIYTLAGLFHQNNTAEEPVFGDITVQSGDEISWYYHDGYRQHPRVESNAEPSSEADSGIELPWIEIAYFTVALTFAGYFGISYVKNIRKFRSSLPLSNEYTARWRRDLGIPEKIRIRQSDEISAPLTYGVFRPVILLPKLILDSENSDSKSRLLDFALTHELTHIRRFDPAIKLLAVAVCCVHWFNPAVWLMTWLLNRDIELSCDERVVAAFGSDSRADYANALISLEEKRSGVPFYTGFCRNAVQERITAIMKTKKTGIISALAACLVVACTIGAFATSAAEPDLETVTELDVIATDGTDGAYRYSDDGGKTFMSEQELMDKYGFDSVHWTDDIEWWTYDEFKEWLEEEKKNLQACLGSTFKTPSRGEVVWTQQEIDDTIAMYEDVLENIKNGALYSKDLDGGIVLCTSPDEDGFDYEISLSKQTSDTVVTDNAYLVSKSKFFPEYETLGLSYDESQDALYFGGERVGYFKDEYKKGAYVCALMDGGEIGVVSVRDDSGRLISLEKTAIPEFKNEEFTVEGEALSSYESNNLSNEEVIKMYGSFGISFNADDKMLYNGKLVRYFCDGVEVGNGFATHYVYLNQAGEVDVYTVREATKNPDGSVDPFGRLTGLRQVTESEFENAVFPYVFGEGDEITATTVEISPESVIADQFAGAKSVLKQMQDESNETTTANSSKAHGKTFEEIFKKYQGLGITFKPSDNGGMGDVYYNGKLLDGFADNNPNGAAFSFKFRNDGNGVAHVVYDDNGEMVGIDVK